LPADLKQLRIAWNELLIHVFASLFMDIILKQSSTSTFWKAGIYSWVAKMLSAVLVCLLWQCEGQATSQNGVSRKFRAMTRRNSFCVLFILSLVGFADVQLSGFCRENRYSSLLSVYAVTTLTFHSQADKAGSGQTHSQGVNNSFWSAAQVWIRPRSLLLSHEIDERYTI